MNHKKPTPILRASNNKICPVCGLPSYSAGGIHPQCAVKQADAPREKQLKAERDAEAKKKQESGQAPPTWRSKKCPRCGAEIHVRRRSCNCGYDFSTP